MNDLADYRRSKNEKKHVHDFPEGILDVIETDYPSQYLAILEGRIRLTILFSNEEWIDILTKSRASYGSHIQRISPTKYSAQGI